MTLQATHLNQVVVAEADAPPPAAAAASEGRDVEGVAEAVASYVAAQYATEAVRALHRN